MRSWCMESQPRCTVSPGGVCPGEEVERRGGVEKGEEVEGVVCKVCVSENSGETTVGSDNCFFMSRS